MANYTKSFLTEFFELYKESTCLWNIKSPQYHDRTARKRAYNALVTKFKEVEPEADASFVKKKINNFRTSYKREVKTVLESSKNSSDAEDVYTPKLWYFKLLSFLEDQELPRTSTTNIIGKEEIEETESISSTSIASSNEMETPNTRAMEFSEDSHFSTTSDIHEIPVKVTKKKRLSDPTEMLVVTIDEKLPSSSKQLHRNRFGRDRFDVFGENVAMKLKSLPNTQRIVAEKLINDVLFEAEMNNLNANCKYLNQNIGLFTNFNPNN